MPKNVYLGEFEQLILLAIVRHRGTAYGMIIRQEIEEKTGRSVSIGAVYTTLDRLENKGYLSSKKGEATPERGGKAKRYFKIRAPGIHALDRSYETLGAMWSGLPQPLGA